MTIAIVVSIFNMLFNIKLGAIFDNIPLVASALITNGNVNAAKLG